MNQRHRKAILRTSLIAVICIVPFMVKSHLVNKYASDDHNLDAAIDPFFMESPEGNRFTRHDLFGTVHLIIRQDATCDDKCQELSQSLLNAVNDKFGKEYFNQETKRLRVLFFSDQPQVVSQEATDHTLEVIHFTSQQAEPLLASIKNAKIVDQALYFAVIDPMGHVVYSDSGSSELTKERLLNQLSKINFNHYLSDYLGKRTFFGPRSAKPGA